ncbi:hypothetical protein CE143_10115 [Photorhabdus luminescens]|uniref:Uncharacterized protein n=1 Tax=Photorhabdus akhurstii TaxID=171438 RepID=A0ABX8LV79_9GAMM|nr:hypothetical protein B0X70_10205 [Photorhabdus akhurstii]UJD75268.1 hypothetical protein CE143_10115 [Photorhabdus luminescens]
MRAGSLSGNHYLVEIKKIHHNSIIEQPNIHTLWISICIATARERIPGSIDNYVTRVSECSQQRGNLKDNGYMIWLPAITG